MFVFNCYLLGGVSPFLVIFQIYLVVQDYFNYDTHWDVSDCTSLVTLSIVVCRYEVQMLHSAGKGSFIRQSVYVLL